MSDKCNNLLLISSDIVGDKIAGPGIRYLEMSKELSRFFNVVLLAPGKQNLPKTEFIVEELERTALKKHLAACDIVISQGLIIEKYPEIKYSEKYLVIDLYNPIMLENLENKHILDKWEHINHYNFVLESIKRQLSIGDYFICASEKQRDFWVGMLTALGRINPANYTLDKSFRKIIDVVPFGLPKEPCVGEKKVIKGIYKSIKDNDFVILWGGGIWNWFDPTTLIKAMKILSKKKPEIKLFFLGKKPPNSNLPDYQFKMYDKTVVLVDEMKLLDKTVFFNDSWVPYADRASYLLEADIGICCHCNTIETDYSFRTRLFDYFWAHLPIITSDGDSISELVYKNGLGVVVKPEDCDGLVNAILKLYDDKKFSDQCSENLNKIAKQFTWDKVIKPLTTYCQNPYFAPDKEKEGIVGSINSFKSKVIIGYKLFRREGFASFMGRISCILRQKFYSILD